MGAVGTVRESTVAAPSAEAELLIACSRASNDASSRERIRRLAAGYVDWNRLVRLSALHGIRPLLFHTVSTVCADLAPPEVLQSLRRYYSAFVLNNARMAVAMAEIADALRVRGIPMRPLKGPALAALAYGDVSLREYGDLDVLVRKQDLAAAIAVLVGRGFAPRWGVVPSGTSPSGHRKYHVLERERDGVQVDLQWMIAGDCYSFSLGDDAFWTRTRQVELNGTAIDGLSPEATLLVLCIHGSKHLWSQLKWTCDVAELLHSCPRLDWEWTLRASGRLGCRRMLALGVLLARELMDAPVEGTVVRRLGGDPVVGELASGMLATLRTGEVPVEGTDVKPLVFLALRERRRDRMRFLLRLCAHIRPEHHAQLRPLPAPFRALYYALVPIREMARYGAPVPRLKSALSNWLERMG